MCERVRERESGESGRESERRGYIPVHIYTLKYKVRGTVS